jgi:hypothetical protein
MWGLRGRGSKKTFACGLDCRLYAIACPVVSSCGGDELANLAEAEGRHAAINRFVLAGLDDVGLMPDADITAAPANSLVERDPCRPVSCIMASRVSLKMLERSPVLHHDLSVAAVAKETGFGMRLELPDHAGHGEEHRKPLVYLPWLVDAHSNEEDDELPVHLGGHAFVNYGGHRDVSLC